MSERISEERLLYLRTIPGHPALTRPGEVRELARELIDARARIAELEARERAALADIAVLEQEVACHDTEEEGWEQDLAQEREEKRAALARAEAAEALLRPFAEEEKTWSRSVADDYRPGILEPNQRTAPAKAEFSIGDLRRAAAHLATVPQQSTGRFRVSVQDMVESGDRKTYWVCLDRSDRPTDAKLWEPGRITPFKSVNREDAESEAREWAQFLGADSPAPEASVSGAEDQRFSNALRVLRQSYVTLAFAFNRLHESSRSRDGELCLDFQKVRAQIEVFFKEHEVKL